MKELYRKVIDHYGKENQLLKTKEELQELSWEIEKDLDGGLTFNREALLNEMADVYNMLGQLMIIYDFTPYQIAKECNGKMYRTIERIEKEKGADKE